MIQFNLLPAVKLEFIKAQRLKRLIAIVSIIVSAVTLAIFIFTYVFVEIVQPKSIKNLDKDISSQTTKLNSPDLNKLLTIQSQVTTLSTLHDQKPVISRIFDLLPKVLPTGTGVSTVSVDFTADNLTFTGPANNVETINTLADGLKNATYTVNGDATTAKLAFSGISLSGLTIPVNSSTKLTYSVSLKFDPNLFNSLDTVDVQVPKTITTVSATGLPGSNPLFQNTPSSTGGQ
jgi:Tfp pilus assembly protein PilN